MIDRAEATGFGVAFAGHAALLLALTLGFATMEMPKLEGDPIEVEIVGEIGLESQAPVPSSEAPAALLAPEEGPPAPAEQMPQPAPPPRIEPVPQPRLAPPAPAPRPDAAQKPAPRPAPPKAAPRPSQKAAQPSPQKGSAARPTGRLSGLLAGLSDRDTQSKATNPPAAKGGPQVEASLVAEVRRQIKPHWQRAVPTGADAEKLRTEVVITLSRAGAVTGMRVVGTSGQTASNRPQVALHQERAKRAITLAAPYRLPAEFYENWKELTITLDLRLSQ